MEECITSYCHGLLRGRDPGQGWCEGQREDAVMKSQAQKKIKQVFHWKNISTYDIIMLQHLC